MEEDGIILLKKIMTSKHQGDFYCLDSLHFFATKNKLESHKNVCENKEFCNVEMKCYLKTVKY